MTPEKLAAAMLFEVRKSAYVQYEADEDQGEEPDLTDVLVDGHVDFVQLAEVVLRMVSAEPSVPKRGGE
jgi:hypothetical protein